ncbi:MAG: class II D-tagatose-bisphosphate aldolase non-catalytic subunit [Acidobacteriota bacterium]
MPTYLSELAQRRAEPGQRGIYSVCSAHPWVLEAAMRRHLSASGPLLIEATCNQVNQYGGYTGMKPCDFRNLVYRIAAQAGFPQERILLGGDHLGPFPWQHLNAEAAMANACALVDLFVRDGYCKIHLDTSMGCADDPHPLPGHLIAERAARLCAVAEAAAAGSGPVYVIGTEVPTPGGSTDEAEMSVTCADRAEEALRLHRQAFITAGVDQAWNRVIALVVQPGVEFGNESVEDYKPEKAKQLANMLTQHPGLIFEAHSTDYQLAANLVALVRDGFAILKVGPALTYAMRQALFALAAVEEACLPAGKASGLRQRVEAAMLENPQHWQKHYPGNPGQQHRLRVHSYSDRIRYYWADNNVQRAVNQMLSNLDSWGIQEILLGDFLPIQYQKVRSGTLSNQSLPLIFDAIGSALDPYIAASGA